MKRYIIEGQNNTMVKSNELTTHRKKAKHINNNKKEITQKTEPRKEWKGIGVVYIKKENWQETEQQKEYKQDQDEA